ncbi:MAG: hypothetical protein AMXMBFR44_6170 [Candidatus Campbellbacteria bacterium]
MGCFLIHETLVSFAYMTWASRRQGLYLLGTIVVLGLLFGVPLYFYLYDEPTCRDGIQNGLEEGVDCGGGCEKVCAFQAIEPIVHWKQEFEVAPGVYTVVALVENANDSYESVAVPYVFRLYDSKNVFIAERKGQVYLSPHMVIPVFETGIHTGERVPTRVEFLFEKEIVWTNSAFSLPDVDVISRRFENEDAAPRLLVTLRNNTLYTFSRIPVVVVLYDASDNALHASRTVIPSLPATSDKEIVFTWPQPFGAPVARVDVVQLYPFSQ